MGSYINPTVSSTSTTQKSNEFTQTVSPNTSSFEEKEEINLLEQMSISNEKLNICNLAANEQSSNETKNHDESTIITRPRNQSQSSTSSSAAPPKISVVYAYSEDDDKCDDVKNNQSFEMRIKISKSDSEIKFSDNQNTQELLLLNKVNEQQQPQQSQTQIYDDALQHDDEISPADEILIEENFLEGVEVEDDDIIHQIVQKNEDVEHYSESFNDDGDDVDDQQNDEILHSSFDNQNILPGCVAPAPTPAPIISRAPLAEVDDDENFESIETILPDNEIKPIETPIATKSTSVNKTIKTSTTTTTTSSAKSTDELNSSKRNAVCPWEDE